MNKLNILVVDDATFIRDMVKRSIRSKFPNITVQEAVDGKKAQSLLKRETFDMVLCDWEMPEMDGEELLVWTREQPQYEKTPFVMVTSRGEKEHLVRAISQGVTDYLTKPFSNDQLLAKVIKALKKTGRFNHQEAIRAPQMQGVAAESVGILTANTAPATASVTPANATAPKAKAKSGKSKFEPAGTIKMRFGKHCIGTVVRDMKLTSAHLAIKNDGELPHVAETIVLDIEDDNEEVQRVNAYIHDLHCAESTPNTRFVLVTAHIIDEDQVKLDFVSRFIEASTHTRH